jgi:hypothetical protein
LRSKEDIDRAGWSGDFDWYRANYQRLSFDDLKRINAIWSQKYPIQRHYNVDFVIDSFRRIVSETGRDQLRIAELGGYNGGLALQVLRVFPRLHWTNIEIIKHTSVSDLRNYQYCEYVLSKQIWEEMLDISDRDVFVSVNTLEHFPNNEMKNIVDYLSKNRPTYLLLSIPTVGGLSWNGYGGSHLLMMGREEVKGLLSGSYAIMVEEGQIISYLFYREIALLRRGAMHSVVKRFSPLLWHLPISRKWNTLWKARG